MALEPFYKSKLPEVQINLHFGYFELVKNSPHNFEISRADCMNISCTLLCTRFTAINVDLPLQITTFFTLHDKRPLTVSPTFKITKLHLFYIEIKKYFKTRATPSHSYYNFVISQPIPMVWRSFISNKNDIRSAYLRWKIKS